MFFSRLRTSQYSYIYIYIPRTCWCVVQSLFSAVLISASFSPCLHTRTQFVLSIFSVKETLKGSSNYLRQNTLKHYVNDTFYTLIGDYVWNNKYNTVLTITKCILYVDVEESFHTNRNIPYFFSFSLSLRRFVDSILCILYYLFGSRYIYHILVCVYELSWVITDIIMFSISWSLPPTNEIKLFILLLLLYAVLVENEI